MALADPTDTTGFIHSRTFVAAAGVSFVALVALAVLLSQGSNHQGAASRAVSTLRDQSGSQWDGDGVRGLAPRAVPQGGHVLQAVAGTPAAPAAAATPDVRDAARTSTGSATDVFAYKLDSALHDAVDSGSTDEIRVIVDAHGDHQ